MKEWKVEDIEAAAHQMATAQEFCGDTANAVKQYRWDNQLPEPDHHTLEAICFQAVAIWNRWRTEAGVKK